MKSALGFLPQIWLLLGRFIWEFQMRWIIGLVVLVGALVALVPIAGSAYAESRAVCQARCDARYNPVDAAKEDRWRVDDHRRACRASCR
jgi:hypothetical protein